ncbi:hypothetical protein J2T60_001774 [Natronospira proteinivora]|uniref:Uncharacterized protein n=1 Tax=Natronospira proteinivora TaxID=1807133 RepID=A0ABT1G8X5_9GAMM|nr:hypothetical protein [Natronospira proteinivora]MCP1727774.1 hypothetical protein [Natronospira proteinivora]
MKKGVMITFATLVSAGSLLSSGPGVAQELENQEKHEEKAINEDVNLTGGGAWGWIIAAILDAVESAVQDEIDSLISDALFGSDGPNVVHLSQQSLDEISTIVDDSNFEVERQNFITKFEALKTDIDDYHDGASLANPYYDFNLLETMRSRSAELVSHHLFREEYNAANFLSAGVYSAAAAKRASILTERVLHGKNSPEHLSAETDYLAGELAVLGAEADQFILQNVWVQVPSAGQCDLDPLSRDEREDASAAEVSNSRDFSSVQLKGLSYIKDQQANPESTLNSPCYFTAFDSIQGRHESYYIPLHGYSGSHRLATHQRNDWADEYRDLFKGGSDYHETIQYLENL